MEQAIPRRESLPVTIEVSCLKMRMKSSEDILIVAAYIPGSEFIGKSLSTTPVDFISKQSVVGRSCSFPDMMFNLT